MPTSAARPKKSERIRLDAALVSRGVFPSRAKAQAAILAGEIYVNGARAAKAGMTVAPGVRLEVHSSRPAFVSRGGLKLEHALDVFGIDVRGLRAADVGSSTGGFTDSLLRRGAARVFAIDVGRGQLDWSLRNDPRVTSLEERDVRDVEVADLGAPVDLATVDVSFISLAKVLPSVRRLVRDGGSVVTLVKPQFEAGPKAAKRGVVRDASVHTDVLRQTAESAVRSGFSVLEATYSPISGPEGNIEYFLHLRAETKAELRRHEFESVVSAAHRAVRRKGEPR